LAEVGGSFTAIYLKDRHHLFLWVVATTDSQQFYCHLLLEMSSFGVDKAITFRAPSTANLMVDSLDRNISTFPSSFDFQITKPNSIMNGFFSRIGTTEVVLEWGEANIQEGTITLDMSGVSVRNNQSVLYLNSFLNVAELLTSICADLSGVNGIGLSVSTNSQGLTVINATGGRIRAISTPLAIQLGLQLSSTLQTSVPITGVPDLRLYRYLDFTSQQLTYAQDLKDTSTAQYNRDVLCRWYMAEDTQETYDRLGFPILMGYEPFVRRRIFNPPKQIKWDNNLPVGNLGFQVYDDEGALVEIGRASCRERVLR
jgi:hypothetical protein